MKKTISLDRNLYILGFGSIGTTALHLILKHIDIDRSKIIIISDSDVNRSIAENYGIIFEHYRVTQENYKHYFSSRLKFGDILLNLSIGISCTDIISLCQEIGSLYLDTSNETWPPTTLTSKTTTYERRNEILKQKSNFINGPTALIYHGANPGLVTHFAKQAVLDVARSLKAAVQIPKSLIEWGRLANSVNITSLHISEFDSQYSNTYRSPDEYVNTWSVDGFLDEASENVTFAWGTHETDLPKEFIKKRADTQNCQIIELNQISAETEILSWVPHKGFFHGHLVPHPEAFSIAELFSLKQDGHLYHPTVHFVYRPCDDALSSMRYSEDHDWVNSTNKRILGNDIISGMDELGILVIRQNSDKVYWFGSQLDISDVRRFVPNTNATSVQVAAGVLSGLIWMIENPQSGLVEPEEIDFQHILNIGTPYLGNLNGYWTNWPKQRAPKNTSEALSSSLQEIRSMVA